MTKRSITQRWLLNSLGGILLVLLVVGIIFALVIKNYYYSSAEQYLTARMNVISSMLVKSAADPSTNFSSEVRNAVVGFGEKEKIELMAINTRGKVNLTSSGFSPSGDLDMTDFYDAQQLSTGTGFMITNFASGEKVMSLCVLLPKTNSEYAAIKMVTSLEETDKQIASFIFIVCIIFLAIIVLVVFSGLYFVKSIVIPVRQIGQTASRFATGDFSARIAKKNDDELGQLCDTINRMADELSNSEAMKNEFISSVSHELRTPLTAIKGWSETLNGVDDPQTIQKGMRVITSETERLSQMVEELLDFSKMQNGRFTLQKEMLDVLAELGEAVMIYQEKANKDNITVVYQEPEMLPFFYGDKNRIKQVFINIIDNAIKYSEAGTVVNVTAFHEGDFVKIAIADSGCGISPVDLPKVKTKFYKANHTKRGSGIGLAVADEIITMHGGTLNIESEQSVGTTVIISLPAIQKTEIKQDADTKAPEGEERKEINEQ